MQSWTTEAIVLKRVSVGEADRVVTLLTPDEGKLVCIAKGVRKMSSSQRAFLEPGNQVTVHVRKTNSLPIITQTQLINQYSQSRQQLKRYLN
jgi:DNA repair protein RecO (recombination protein O)